ncbi:hypothetical protein D4764_11G0006430 [Takifugu flavidus]|uniref:Uncharacterized protein n=2 Tax=Takifugu flavidus TaxID=433684 RepID=A0A5C6PFL9_9TELE|nr:hypothetical protein D4764_11G0006430 [Takifugu flavidus]
MFEVNSAPQVSEPAPNQDKPASESKPAPGGAVLSTPPEPARPTVATVSDVAAPGVPESEQTHTVVIKPPPFITLGDGGPKSEKPKTNLAAAKAQDLFGIFYSSSSLSGTFSISRPAKTDRRNDSGAGKTQPQNPPSQKLQPQDLVLPPPQPPPSVLEPHPDGSEELQTKTELDIQISSVWSLQTTQDPEPWPSPSKPTSQTIQQEFQEQVQQEDHYVSPNRSQSLNPDSIMTTDNGPSQPDLTQKEPESQPQPNQEDQPSLDNSSNTSPASEAKPGNKPRGKANARKRTSPASHPVHQTRSQTRYQTRQQRQNQSEQDLTSGDSGSAASDSKVLDTSGPGCGSQPEVLVQDIELELTPESLGLPSDMTSLDFESGFNFE